MLSKQKRSVSRLQKKMPDYLWFEYCFSFVKNKSAMQTAWLHDLSVMQHLEKPGTCMLLGIHFELWVLKRNILGKFPASFFFFFLNFCLAAPVPTLGYYWGDRRTHPMLITAFYLGRPKSHREPLDEAGSPSPAKHLEGFETGTFPF